MRFASRALLLVLFGCAAYDYRGVEPADASFTDAPDGGDVDASTRDAGEQDAGEADAGEADAGGQDAGEQDAGPDGGETDGGVLDGGGECVASSCPAGRCCGDACCRLKPSNGDAIGDFEHTGVVSLDGPTFRFDTGLCGANQTLGTCTAGTFHAEPCVCRVTSLVVGQQGVLRVVGSRPLIVLAAKTIVVDGVIDVGGDGTESGPGASRNSLHTLPNEGGPGGSHGGVGAGSLNPATNGGFEPLRAGIDGQATSGAAGGKAGGAIQLSAAASVTVAGRVQANGGGGRGSTNGNGGGGGGSGGTIVIEAPTVVVRGGLFANGGAGGGGGGMDGSTPKPGQPGEDGSLSENPATGGAGGDGQMCVLETLVGGDGGRGGTTSSDPTTGQSGAQRTCLVTNQQVWPGGGGGAVGLVRIRAVTRDIGSATLSPLPSTDAPAWW